MNKEIGEEIEETSFQKHLKTTQDRYENIKDDDDFIEFKPAQKNSEEKKFSFENVIEIFY